MIRRILLFLTLLFVTFFVYRRYDKTAADSLLSKIRNLSFSSTPKYTTQSTDPITGETTIIPENGRQNWTSNTGLTSLIQKINDTLTDKTTWSYNDERLIRSIITSGNLEQSVQLPGLSGEVIVSDKPIETLPKIPTTPPSTTTTTTNSNTTTLQPTTLTPEEMRQAEEIARMFE